MTLETLAAGAGSRPSSPPVVTSPRFPSRCTGWPSSTSSAGRSSKEYPTAQRNPHAAPRLPPVRRGLRRERAAARRHVHPGRPGAGVGACGTGATDSPASPRVPLRPMGVHHVHRSVRQGGVGGRQPDDAAAAGVPATVDLEHPRRCTRGPAPPITASRWVSGHRPAAAGPVGTESGTSCRGGGSTRR